MTLHFWLITISGGPSPFEFLSLLLPFTIAIDYARSAASSVPSPRHYQHASDELMRLFVYYGSYRAQSAALSPPS